MVSVKRPSIEAGAAKFLLSILVSVLFSFECLAAAFVLVLLKGAGSSFGTAKQMFEADFVWAIQSFCLLGTAFAN